MATTLAAPTCSLENYLVLPDHSADQRIAAARKELADQAVILGHHYQRDEVIRFADFRGDSFRLAQVAAETDAQYIVYCGVHFMAESADILGREDQHVILPDLNAGCSMADMAETGQVEDCWEQLVKLGITADEGDQVTPMTYMNSAAAIKAFCGERGGLVCTSSNAAAAFKWGFARTPKIFFLPDQHLGRNTAIRMGIPLSDMAVWDPFQIMGGNTPERLRSVRVILWKGHCSVHQRFLPEHVDNVRGKYPDIQVIVHPECRMVALYRTAKVTGCVFDAVVLDLTVIGGMGGVETAAKLKELNPLVKLIVSSGYSDGSVMANYREYGFDDVIPKPWQTAQLGEVLRRVLVVKPRGETGLPEVGSHNSTGEANLS
jgi:quinolinate synthetase A subunit